MCFPWLRCAFLGSWVVLVAPQSLLPSRHLLSVALAPSSCGSQESRVPGAGHLLALDWLEAWSRSRGSCGPPYLPGGCSCIGMLWWIRATLRQGMEVDRGATWDARDCLPCKWAGRNTIAGSSNYCAVFCGAQEDRTLFSLLIWDFLVVFVVFGLQSAAEFCHLRCTSESLTKFYKVPIFGLYTHRFLLNQSWLGQRILFPKLPR